MGQPAARIGDTSMHGGTVMAGCPTVLIGGMPAARMGDMHVCPMVTPGTPPIPHVGGPIMKGSTGVLIGGMPAARLGDMALCTGPPDSIMMGCMTVLIGETMAVAGGGGGGAGGAGAGMGSAAQSALASASMAGATSQSVSIDNHFLDVTFQDKAGKPIGGVAYTMKGPNGTTTGGVLSGTLQRNGVEQGNYQIQLRAIANAQWDKQKAEVGETVKLIVETAGIDSGEKIMMEVYLKDGNYTDHLLASCEGTIQGDTAEVPWTLAVDETYLSLCRTKEKHKRYSRPFFFFVARVGELREKSGILEFVDHADIEVVDNDGTPIADKKFKARCADGRVKTGTLDANGRARVDDVSPGEVDVEVDLRG